MPPNSAAESNFVKNNRKTAGIFYGYNYDSTSIFFLFDSHSTAVRLRHDHSMTYFTTAAETPKATFRFSQHKFCFGCDVDLLSTVWNDLTCRRASFS